MNAMPLNKEYLKINKKKKHLERSTDIQELE